MARQSRCALLTRRALTEYVKFQRPVSSGYRCSCAPFACAPLYMACNPLYTTLHHYGYNYSRSDKKMQPLFFIFFCRKSKNFWVFRKCHKKRAKKVPGNSNSRSKTPERCRLVRVSKAVTVAIMESNMHCTDCPCEARPTRIGGACPSVNWQYSPFPFKNQVLFQIFKNLHKIYLLGLLPVKCFFNFSKLCEACFNCSARAPMFFRNCRLTGRQIKFPQQLFLFCARPGLFRIRRLVPDRHLMEQAIQRTDDLRTIANARIRQHFPP